MTARDLAVRHPGLRVAYRNGSNWANGRVVGYHLTEAELIIVEPDDPHDGWLLQPDPPADLVVTLPGADRGWAAAMPTLRLPTPAGGWPHVCRKCGCPAQAMFQTVECSSPACWT